MKIEYLFGKNFSKRSYYLKHLSDLKRIEGQGIKNVYLGPLPHQFLTGIGSTVKNELNFHCNGSYEGNFLLKDLLEGTGIFDKININPFNLSGGEQAILNIITGLSLSPYALSLDCITEQLYKPTLDFILCKLRSESDINTEIIICDNRKENFIDIHKIKVPNDLPIEKIKKHSFNNISSQDINIEPIENKSIKVNNLSFGYDKKNKVINNMNLELEPGKLYYLSGRNGVGKSTLSKILTGILKPFSGEIYWGDKLVKPYYTPGKIFGYHFQTPDEQIFASTVEDEIFPNKKFNESNRNSVLKTFGISEVGNKHPFDMPLTIRKRIALAATIAMKTPWLIFDEPSLFLDDDNLFEVTLIIKELISNGYGVILISHSDWFKKEFDFIELKMQNGTINN